MHFSLLVCSLIHESNTDRELALDGSREIIEESSKKEEDELHPMMRSRPCDADDAPFFSVLSLSSFLTPRPVSLASNDEGRNMKWRTALGHKNRD